MKNKKKKTLQDFRSVIWIVLIVVAFSVVCGLVFNTIYQYTEKAAIDIEREQVEHTCHKVNNHLSGWINAIQITSVKINKMQKDNKTSEEILKYLQEESELYTEEIDKNFTGLYGYINGEYLDGVGYVPEKGYIPQDRPWYKEAYKEGGKIVFVEPYLDVQTNKIMMSISRLLDDGVSVVSLDVELDTIQQIVEESITENSYKGMILTENGFVVADSERDEVGKDYSARSNVFGKMVMESINSTNSEYGQIKYDGTNYLVFSDHITESWDFVLITNRSSLYRATKYLYIQLGVFICVFIIVFLVVEIRMGKRKRKTEGLIHQIRAVSDIYMSMYSIDLEENTFQVINSSAVEAQIIAGDQHNPAQIINKLVTRLVEDQSIDEVLAFVDFETLEERLAESQTVALEFIGKQSGWCRGRFVVVDRKEDGSLSRILWMIEVIDEEKRRQNQLLYLSETDLMTGINNRGSGENKIKSAMQQGKGGMFCLMDADKFKSINDNYGHDVGDKVIIEIARCLQKAFRDNDIVLRLGGDEFAAFAVGVTDEKIGNKIIERFFNCIDEIDIPELGDRKICVSVGAALYLQEDHYSFDEIYKKADTCTYLSKKVQGNKVTFY